MATAVVNNQGKAASSNSSGPESDGNKSSGSLNDHHGVGYPARGVIPPGGGGGSGGRGGRGGPPGGGEGPQDHASLAGRGSTGGNTARSGGAGSMGMHGAQIYSSPFINKLMSFGLSYDMAIVITQNEATTAFAIMQLFGKAALKDLFGPDYRLDKVPLLVKQRVKVFHHWLQTRHSEGEDLKTIDLDIFDNNVMVALLEEELDEGPTKARGSSIKDSGMPLPTFNGNQPASLCHLAC